MTVFGVDFSLTSTGLASWDGAEWDTTRVKTPSDGGSRGEFLDRVDDIAARVINWCDPHHGDVICLEGPAFSAKSSNLDRIFGGWWRLYSALRDHHSEPWVIPPAVVKQLATGKGNAGKDEVLIQTVRRIPAAPVQGNDDSDAIWLAVAASVIARNPALELPQKHLDGIDKLLRGLRKETP